MRYKRPQLLEKATSVLWSKSIMAPYVSTFRIRLFFGSGRPFVGSSRQPPQHLEISHQRVHLGNLRGHAVEGADLGSRAVAFGNRSREIGVRCRLAVSVTGGIFHH